MYIDDYKRWLSTDLEDPALTDELRKIDGQDNEIKERFAVALKFGTAGLRGILGAGSNRMNIYVVRQATQGLANWVKTQGGSQLVAISYDSRINSDVFARNAACVLAANGIRVRIYDALMPVPALSFATRYYKANAGIMITASHNPAKYNGYKAYGPDGCQMTDDAAAVVYAEIQKTDILTGAEMMSFEDGIAKGLIEYVGEDCKEALYSAIEACAVRPGICKTAGLKLVYSPLNGSGLVPVTRVLHDIGIDDITIVPEQQYPDGNFPTCPYPNPEIQEALALGLEYCQKLGADLLLANDPDCDRVGTAVRDGDGYRLISGNEMGVLLFDYICKMRTEQGTMPQNPVAVKTIVTTEMAAKVAEAYGVELRNTLTGFKFIGEQIGLLEKDGQENRYIWGFEESYGYLSGSFVRDKDGVNASLLICEMFAYYQSKGLSLVDVLHGLYAKYGAFQNALQSFTFEGAEGFATMQKIMADFRENAPAEVLGRKVLRKSDYKTSVMTDAAGKTSPIDMPSSDVLKFDLEGDISLVVRPSGTEPKLKIYYSVKADSEEQARALVEQYQTHYAKVMDGYR